MSASLSLFLTNVQSLIAGSASWQTWTGHANDPASAARSVYLVGVTPPKILKAAPDNQGYAPADFDALRPFIILNYAMRDGYDGRQDGISAFVERARVMFSFEDSVPPEDAEDYQAAVTSFLDNVGSVLADLQALAGVDGNANLHDIRLERAPTRADQTERATRGDYHVVIFSAEVGI